MSGFGCYLNPLVQLLEGELRKKDSQDTVAVDHSFTALFRMRNRKQPGESVVMDPKTFRRYFGEKTEAILGVHLTFAHIRKLLHTVKEPLDGGLPVALSALIAGAHGNSPTVAAAYRGNDPGVSAWSLLRVYCQATGIPLVAPPVRPTTSSSACPIKKTPSRITLSVLSKEQRWPYSDCSHAELVEKVKAFARERYSNLELKPEQAHAVASLLLGKDLFLALPCGIGKSLCGPLYCAFQRTRTNCPSVILWQIPSNSTIRNLVKNSG